MLVIHTNKMNTRSSIRFGIYCTLQDCLIIQLCSSRFRTLTIRKIQEIDVSKSLVGLCKIIGEMIRLKTNKLAASPIKVKYNFFILSSFFSFTVVSPSYCAKLLKKGYYYHLYPMFNTYSNRKLTYVIFELLHM